VTNLLVPLLLILAAFGAFCFNMGHRRAYRIVLKGLIKGQIGFLIQQKAFLNDNQGKLSQDMLNRALFSYETIGQLVIGWYKNFGVVRDDKELLALKLLIKNLLGEYLSAIEAEDSFNPR
jgi:hypothetical protein